MKGFSWHGATGRRLQGTEGGFSISPGGGGAVEVPNAEAELAGQTIPTVDAIEGAGEASDAEEERDRKAAKQRKYICGVCRNGRDYGTIQQLQQHRKTAVHKRRLDPDFAFEADKRARRTDGQRRKTDAQRAARAAAPAEERRAAQARNTAARRDARAAAPAEETSKAAAAAPE